MSKQGRDRDPYDPLQPSTSSGYRKPYSRPSETGRDRSGRGTVKTVDSREYGDAGAGPSHSRHDTTETQVVPRSGEGDVASTQPMRRKKETIFVSKPATLKTKKGKSGRQIILQSNHFKLLTVPNWCLYQYRVDFEPEESRTVIRKGLFRLHKEKIGPYIFDGTMLFMTSRLSDVTEMMSVRKSDGEQIKITIRLVGNLVESDSQYIQFFNIIMRKCLENLKLQLVGRNYFDAQEKVNVNQFRLQLWPGYITSIRQHERDILMSTEITHKVLRQDTILHMLNDCYNKCGPNDFKQEFSRNVVDSIVLTGYNNNTYRVEDIDFETTPSSTFKTKTGEEISYQDYYKKRYQIDITVPTQPMLVVKSRSKVRSASSQDHLVYLVPELCCATGLSDNMREQFHLMKALAVHTKISPESRIDKLMRFNRRLRDEPKVVQELKDWNMTLDRSLTEFPARILNPERLFLGGDRTITAQSDWARDMQRMSLLHCKDLRQWVVLGLQRDSYAIKNFIGTITRISGALSFRMEQPQVHYLREDKSSTYVENLEYILGKSVPQLVFCIVSNNRADRYAAIKKKCCVDRPIPSQVFLLKNLTARSVQSIATKVAIQMNCKLGGAPWRIEIPVKSMMAIGFDICRDTNTKGRDYVAMVATVNQQLTQYFSCISMYHNVEERAEQICAGVAKAVQVYRSLNKALPMYLMIYRDGVSEGEVSEVFNNEVENLKKRLEQVYYGPHFKMIYIIVSKRVNVRLFCNRRNPPIGTVVDDVITSPFKYDFYLVSQQVREGTISPTAYNIISDNSGLDPDMVQTITYKLTHMYFNCSTTVRVPAPCHYAYKLSHLVGQFLHRPPNTQLEHKLFYL